MQRPGQNCSDEHHGQSKPFSRALSGALVKNETSPCRDRSHRALAPLCGQPCAYKPQHQPLGSSEQGEASPSHPLNPEAIGQPHHSKVPRTMSPVPCLHGTSAPREAAPGPAPFHLPPAPSFHCTAWTAHGLRVPTGREFEHLCPPGGRGKDWFPTRVPPHPGHPRPLGRAATDPE